MRSSRIVLVLATAAAVLLCTRTAARADREPVKIDNTKEFEPGPSREAPAGEVLAPPDYLFPLPLPKGRVGVVPATGPATGPTAGPTTSPITSPTAERATRRKQLRALQAVPADATAVAWFTDLARTRTLLADCALGKLAAEPGVQRFLHEIGERLEAREPGLPSYGYFVRAAELMRRISKDAAVALLRDKGKPRVLLVAAVSEEKRSAVEAAARGLSEALAGAHGVTAAAREHDLAGALFREVQAGNVAVYHGFVENLLVLAAGLEDAAAGREIAEAAVKLASAEGTGSFEKSAARAECLKALGMTAEADLYLTADLGRIPAKPPLAAAHAAGLEQTERLLAETEEKEKIGKIHAALVVEGERVHERVVLGGRLAEMSPLGAGVFGKDASVLGYVPPDVLYFEAGNRDDAFACLSAHLKETLGPAADEKLVKDMLAAREKVEPALGAQYARGISVSMTGTLQSFLAMELKDPAPVRAFLSTFHRGLGLTETATFLGETLHYVREEQIGGAGRPAARRREAGTLFSAPSALQAYAITKTNVLVTATDAAALRKCLRSAALARRATLERRSVLELPHVKEVTGKLPEEASSLGYLDLERTVEFFYTSEFPQIGFRKAERPSEAALARLGVLLRHFPLLDELLPHLGGAAWAGRRKADALVLDVHSSTGLLPSVSLGVAAALPLLARASEISGVAQHERHLRIIWRGLQDYATNHGRFPRKLEDLYPEYVQFQRPGVELDRAGQKAILAQYEFVTARRPNDCATAPLAYTAKPTGPGTGYVVMVMDGRLVPASERDLKSFLRGEISFEEMLKKVRMQ